MNYNILVIGNGFDLAHGLPTRYLDFLDFCHKIQTYAVNIDHEAITLEPFSPVPSSLQLSSKIIAWGFSDDNEFVEALKNKSQDWVKYPLYDQIKSNIMDNVWLKHFYTKAEDKTWVDFETEISRIIAVLDEIYWEYNQAGHPDTITLNSSKHNIENIKAVIDDLNKSFNNNAITIHLGPKKTTRTSVITLSIVRDEINKFLSTLDSDINELIDCLSFYLNVILYLMDSKKMLSKIAQISEIKVDKVLSFNYTDTYERIYEEKEKDPVEWKDLIEKKYHNIHGSCKRNENSENAMVLGVDDYLEKNEDKDLINYDTFFISYKKYYQRILKKTGTKYLRWIEALNTNGFRSDVYIYGHSLDKTDKDVLRGLILSKQAKTKVFYLDREDLGKKIANLVTVLGRENVISLTGNNKLSFVEIERPGT